MSDDLLNMLDSEVASLHDILMWAREQQHKRRTSEELEGFQREVHQRFNAAGFLVNILVYDTNVFEVFAFDFEVIGKIEPKQFDYDKMRHEVQNNYLDIPGAGGTINADTELARMERERRSAGKHKH